MMRTLLCVLRRTALATAGAAALAATPAARAELIYGVTDTQTLVTWDSTSATNLISGVAINGLQANERVLGIDFRPATGQLYALGSFSRLYTLNASTGMASLVGSGLGLTLNGSSFGFDFNPTIDRIRVVSDTNKNYVLHPDTGAGTIVTDLFYPAGDPNAGVDPSVVHSSYTNSFAGATTSQLYGLDTKLDLLATQANSAGTLGTVGPLGVDVTDVGGFDISGATGIAYVALTESNQSKSSFWTISLATGMATSMASEIAGGAIITAMAVAPAVPEPSATVLATGLAGLLACRLRRGR
ncbi:MAG: DUF4394 domain-containing protein [Pirellulales bacterium]|nr:DUF4394 domain-containing protein [Pirellulales bacterium]